MIRASHLPRKAITPSRLGFILLLLCSPLRAEDISTAGWRLWPDTKAEWRDDTLYLPDQVDLARLPVNPPTGGWGVLDERRGIAVLLPGTVEEHYWGAFGSRPYGADYKFGDADLAVRNGNYPGVSWWWRELDAPPVANGERLVVRFRGARHRAEVYCNGTLCAYSILAELPFEADITDAVRPRVDNVLAVRITNPGGVMDWRDSISVQWGKYRLGASRGFGGLDGGIEVQVRAAATVDDLAVLNRRRVRQVRLQAEVVSADRPFSGDVVYQIARHGKALWNDKVPVRVKAGERATVSTTATLEDAVPWDLEHPELYRASARLEGVEHSGRETDFGFRWFDAEGIGTHAKLTLNGKRIVVRSAISWGFWGPNGLWPSGAMAEREIENARAMGLNCLHSHRNLANPLVLAAGDRLGLLRGEEPGGGKHALGAENSDRSPAGQVDTSGAGGETDDFQQEYVEAKILAMVRRDRSHPSLVLYCVQNEMTPQLDNPRIFHLLRLMHAIDPSRIIVLKSGIKPINQAWMRPYEDEVHVDDGTGSSGWHDEHTVGGPGNYQDGLYSGPDRYSHDAAFAVRPGKAGGPPVKPEVVVWGEMLGVGTPDDHQAVVEWYRKTGRSGYDRGDHERILASYREFLDRHGFRDAFPTVSDLFRAIGLKSYVFWQMIVEQCRFSNRADAIVLNGWESTAIENHSGLVDAHRNVKSDPAVVRRAMEPELLAVRARHLVLARGDTGEADIFLVNETGRAGPHRLTFTAQDAAGRTLATHSAGVDVEGGDVYGQLLKSGLEFPAPSAGMLTLQSELTPEEGSGTSLHREEQVLVVDVRGPAFPERIAIVEPGHAIARALSTVFGVEALGRDDLDGPLDAVILSADAPEDGDDGADAVWEGPLDAVLKRVSRDGVRLVLWTDDAPSSAQFARALARRGVLRFEGLIGGARASWMGNWYFVREHWLFDGLPTDCALDWRYQVAAERHRGGGLQLSAPGLEVMVGYGRDHEAGVGVGACVIPHGQGRIVLFCLPGMSRALEGDGENLHPVIARRLLGNALR